MLVIALASVLVITTGAGYSDYTLTSMEEEQEMLTAEYKSDSLEQRDYLNLSARPRHWPRDIQDYTIGSIRLYENPQDIFPDGQPEDAPLRRSVFYRIDGFIIDLVPQEDAMAFFNYTISNEREPATMPLVEFILYFDITREMMEFALMQMEVAGIGVADFVAELVQKEQAQAEIMMASPEVNMVMIQENYRGLESDPWYDPFADLMHEVHELPNLDVIFTFDNEIINWYYRRG